VGSAAGARSERPYFPIVPPPALTLDNKHVEVLQRDRDARVRSRSIHPLGHAMTALGVNIDHVATVREARKTNEPDPVWAASLAELGGADGITLHLREDRRHIQERDLHLLRQTVTVKLNLELACDDAVLAIACQTRPYQATLVPERREEVTTEGGLDAAGQTERIAAAVQRLRDAGIVVSLFLDPDPRQIDAAVKLGVDAVELHTGAYGHATAKFAGDEELKLLQDAAAQIVSAGLTLHAGHGLTYRNVKPIAAIPQMCELNIGHSIIARAIMVGLEQAVRDMKRLISECC
jgi:pyridoxine 5-phosphate synthase